MSDMKWLQKQEHFDWMQKCLICWKMSEEVISKSIQNGEYVYLINACRDTAEMCSQCIKFEAQRSPFFQHLCEVCAEICENCSKKLSEHKNESKIISDTSKACMEFAFACRKVVEAKEQISKRD